MSFLNPIRRRGQYSVWHAVAALLIALICADFATCLIQGTGHGTLLAQLFAADQYVRPVAGSDANDGLQWATPRQTITTASAGLSDGDTVYVEESPAPTSIGGATWTAGDRSVVLSTACTALVYACDTYSWLNAANVTCAVTSNPMKEGTHSAYFVIDASATTGVMATANRGADLDCSGYQQISFWVRTSAALTANYLAVAMYSDDYPTAALTNLVGKAYVPAIPAANLWMPITVNYGGALGTVRTIALIAETDTGAVGVYLDDILACKAPTEADSLTLTSLISKNTAGEPWFALASINGTAVELESIGGLPSSTIGSYGGTTDVTPVTTYKRETWKTAPVAAASTAVQTISDSTITIAGGYTAGKDVTVDPTGVSWFDGANGNGYGINSASKSNVDVLRIGTARYYQGIRSSGTATAVNLDTCYAVAIANSGLVATGTHTDNAWVDCSVTGSAGSGIFFNVANGTCSDSVVHGCGTSGYVFTNTAVLSGCVANATAAGIGIEVSTTASRVRIVNCTANGLGLANTGLVLDALAGLPARIENLTTANNTAQSVYIRAGGKADFWNASLGDASEVGFETTTRDDYVTSTNHDDATGSHYKWEYGATYNSQQAVVHTAGGWAWQLSPTNAARSSTWPLRLPIGQVALTSGVPTTVTAWMQRSNTGLSGGLVCPGGQITGIASDVSDTSWTVAAGEWEQQSITLQSTENGVVEVEARAWDGTTWSLYVDDAGSTTSATFTGLDLGDGGGPVWINSAAGGGTRVTGGM